MGAGRDDAVDLYPQRGGPGGPISSAWDALLKSDCADCPWWPDILDPAKVRAAARMLPPRTHACMHVLRT